MNELIATVLICCGSVSSGYSGKPTGAYIAEALRLPVQDEAVICRRQHNVIDRIDFRRAVVVVNLDGSYWASLDRDCTKGVEAVRKFYEKTKGKRVVIATVPVADAGGFNRAVCGAESAVQLCRAPLNQAIVAGCGDGCTLLDADAIYQQHQGEEIHLTPQVWREAASEIITTMRAEP